MNARSSFPGDDRTSPEVATGSAPVARMLPWPRAGAITLPLHRLRPVAGWVAVIALALGLAAAPVWPGTLAIALAAAAGALLAAAVAAWLLVPGPQQALARDLAAVDRLLGADPDRLFVTSPTGAVPDPALDPVVTALADWCAAPDEVVASLGDEAARHRSGRREFRRGTAGLLVAVHALGSTRADEVADPDSPLLWRLTPIARAARRGLDVLGLPVLTLGPEGQAAFANPALMRLLDAERDAIAPGANSGPGPAGNDGTALQPLLDQVLPALARGESRFEPRLPGGQPIRALMVPGSDGQRDILFLPPWLGDHALPLAAEAPEHEDIPVALVRIDGDGRIATTNRAARTLLGLGLTEDRHLWEVVEGLGRPVADWLQDARNGRALNRPEVLRATSAGSETFVQIILRRAGAVAPPGSLLAVISDATELKSLEARFVQSQKMQAIGQLAGGVAHDFNNLLTAISGHCDLLLMGRDPFDADYNDLVQIHQNANRAAALVRQLLAFSRKQTLQPESLRPEEMLEEVVHLLTRLVGERITLTLRHDPALPRIRADRRQLEQVIVNLVVNARDAMPMGGEIRIETRAEVLREDRAIGRVRVPPGDYALIRVIDSGVGIAPELVEKIFEPFFTTKRPGEGTGLGLSTAYGIVKQMGGFIFVDSIEGSGTTFTLYFGAETRQAGDLGRNRSVETAPPAPDHRPGGVDVPGRPVAEPAPPPARTEIPSRRPSAPTALPTRLLVPSGAGADVAGIVLLVEDEAPVRAFAARALRMQGYQVLEAQDGEQALEVLADPGLAVDVFVTDVIMPGLDGPGWVARALRDRPGTPVVFVSGYIEDSLTEALGRTPNAVFLEKPFSLAGLIRTIAGQLAQTTA